MVFLVTKLGLAHFAGSNLLSKKQKKRAEFLPPFSSRNYLNQLLFLRSWSSWSRFVSVSSFRNFEKLNFEN